MTRAWYREITWPQWRVLIASWALWSLDAIDFLILTYVLPDIARTFHLALAQASLLLLATYGVRWIGGLFVGSISDRVGRKLPLLVTLAWFTCCAVLTGLAPTFTAIVAFRLLLGFGMAPGFSLGATLIAETWPKEYRAIALGIHDSGWGIGGIGASLIYWFLYPHLGWRPLFFVGVVPALVIGAFIACCVPESTIWRSRPRREVGIPAFALFRRHPRTVAYLTLLMLVLFFTNWPMIGLFPTYLKTLHFPPHVIAQLGLTASIGEVVGFAMSGMIAEQLGRRNGLTLMLVCGAICVAAMVRVIHLPLLAFPAAFASGACIIGMAGIWGSILAENLPTEVRATGVGFLYNVGSFGGGLAPFVALSTIHGLRLDFGTGLAAITAASVVVSIVVLRFTRETKGIALNDVAGDADDADVPEPVTAAPRSTGSPQVARPRGT
ncbi:MAG TPA: MFS transporter [Candidatus Limnocylindria bacterium]|jgi:SHS family sialic acid transporter-like MFS transporter|nr:MFS transporter [Candidatus Limnocylindria bacterium]